MARLVSLMILQPWEPLLVWFLNIFIVTFHDEKATSSSYTMPTRGVFMIQHG